MIAVTSISPTHINKDIQLKATKSWIDCGMKVYSLNSKKECDLLSSLYPDVSFIETDRTMELDYGKPYVSLDAIFDFFKSTPDSKMCLINSDIELKTDKNTILRIKDKMEKALVVANRVNYDLNYQGNRFLDGIDVFFIDKKFMPYYPRTMYCLGQCHFDYHIPYTALKNGIDVIFLKQDIAFHKNHAAQYNPDHWKKTGRFFLWQHNLYQFCDTTGIGQMSKYVFNYIYNASKRIEI